MHEDILDMNHFEDKVDWKEYREFSKKLLKKNDWIPIFTKFCSELEAIVLTSIFEAQSKGKKRLVILINSFGGQITSLTSIHAALQITEMETVGVVLGKACSAGFSLLQACDRRLAVPSSLMRPHWGSGGLSNNELSALRKGEKWPVEHEMSLRGALFDIV